MSNSLLRRNWGADLFGDQGDADDDDEEEYDDEEEGEVAPPAVAAPKDQAVETKTADEENKDDEPSAAGTKRKVDEAGVEGDEKGQEANGDAKKAKAD